MPGTPATTSRLGIPRYGDLDAADIGAIANSISDRVDVVAGRFESGLEAALPTSGPGIADRFFWATDTKRLWRDAGGTTPTFELANKPPLVTSLPSSPFDGQEVYFLADATNGIIWNLRYRAASTSSYKWEVIAGSSLYSLVDSQSTTTSSTAVALGGPSVVVPLAGDYEVMWSGRLYNGNAAGASSQMSLWVSGAQAFFMDAYQGTAGSSITMAAAHNSRTVRVTGVAAGATVECRYKQVGGGSAIAENRSMTVRPVRVG